MPGIQSKSEVSVYEYAEFAEAWKPAHDLEMACCDFESVVARGLKTLEDITAAHEDWQTSVLSGQEAPSLKVDLSFWDIYAWWLRPADRLTRELQFFEDNGFVVNRADEFRQQLHELVETRRHLRRPTSALRPFTAAEITKLSSRKAGV